MQKPKGISWVLVLLTASLAGCGDETNQTGNNPDAAGPDAAGLDGFDTSASDVLISDVSTSDATESGDSNDVPDVSEKDTDTHEPADVPVSPDANLLDGFAGDLGDLIEPDVATPDADAWVPDVTFPDVGDSVPMIIINEVLMDGSADGDPNGDGSLDPIEDEFVELVNVGDGPADLSNWTLVEGDFDVALPRHTFPQGTILMPYQALVVFGGGDAPESTPTNTWMVANAADPGISFGLDLNDDADTLRLLDETGAEHAVLSWGPGAETAPSDESLTRSPDLTGDFTAHSTTGEAVMSPGTQTDGTSFVPSNP